MSTELEERLITLEIRYTHQEDLVEVLSQQVHELTEQITVLKAQLKHNQESIQSMSGSSAMNPVDETPPHY